MPVCVFWQQRLNFNFFFIPFVALCKQKLIIIYFDVFYCQFYHFHRNHRFSFKCNMLQLSRCNTSVLRIKLNFDGWLVKCALKKGTKNNNQLVSLSIVWLTAKNTKIRERKKTKRKRGKRRIKFDFSDSVNLRNFVDYLRFI